MVVLCETAEHNRFCGELIYTQFIGDNFLELTCLKRKARTSYCYIRGKVPEFASGDISGGIVKFKL